MAEDLENGAAELLEKLNWDFRLLYMNADSFP
jgi:hypothetical protein